MLGDGGVAKDKRINGKLSFHITHGEKQLEYLKYKLNSLSGCDAKIHNGKSGYCDNKVYSGGYAIDGHTSDMIVNEYYHNGEIKLTNTFINRITPVSLAIWYMDDGSLKYRDKPGHEQIMISSNSFSKEDNQLLVDMLIHKFNIPANIRKDKNYWGIYIPVSGVRKFLQLITPYIHPTMRYKTLKEFEDIPFKGFDVLDRKKQLVPIKVVEIIKNPKTPSGRYVYDLEIEGNHNFFANNILTHNCENQPFRVGDGKEYILTEKLDGCSCTYALERKGKHKFEYYVCSRNVRLLDPKQRNYITDNGGPNIYWEMSDKYNIEQHLKDYLISHPECRWVCIQGEGVGNVQGNPLKLAENDLYVFNFIDSQVGRYGSYEGQKIINSWGMKWVPILGYGKTQDTMEELKEFADGKSVVNPKVIREGIVYRTPDGKDSFKNVSRKYLLKQE